MVLLLLFHHYNQYNHITTTIKLQLQGTRSLVLNQKDRGLDVINGST